MKLETIIAGFIGVTGGYALKSALEKDTISPAPPVELKSYVKQRTENIRGVVTTIPAHWEIPIVININPGVWYVLFENIPREMGWIASDDYTSPIMLIHDGKQAWYKDRSDAWIVAIMQQDGGSKCDVFYKNKQGTEVLLFEEVRNPYYYDVETINGIKYVKRDKLYPKAKLIEKITLDVVPW